MRKLRDCEFCGAEAAGTFEVVPAELTPDGGGRRAVLCGDCASRLEEFVEPLLDAARADAGRSRRSDRGGDANPASDPEATGSGATGDGADPDDAGGGSVRDGEGRESDGEGHESGDEGGTSDETSVAFESTDGTDRPTRDDGAGDGDDGTGDEPASADASGDGSDRADGDGDGSDRPRAYGKVLRLVRNREFPMERTAVESLAAGAYDLTDREARRAIDRAIEAGKLREDGDRLRRP